MARALADLDELEDLARALVASRQALGDLDAVTRLGAEVSGSADVAQAVADVADDWDHRRERRSSALGSLAAYTEAAVQAFADADATVVTVTVPAGG